MGIIKTGIDIVREKSFLNSYKHGGDSFINHLFTPQEIRQNTALQLASIFCLKEAVMKALELSKDSWLMINTNRKENGKIQCSLSDRMVAQKIHTLDTSLCHDGGWIIGIAVAVLECNH